MDRKPILHCCSCKRQLKLENLHWSHCFQQPDDKQGWMDKKGRLFCFCFCILLLFNPLFLFWVDVDFVYWVLKRTCHSLVPASPTMQLNLIVSLELWASLMFLTAPHDVSADKLPLLQPNLPQLWDEVSFLVAAAAVGREMSDYRSRTPFDTTAWERLF